MRQERRKEQIMSAVFDRTAVGICLTDEKGRFVEVNDAYCNIYGYTRKELLGSPFTIVVQDKERESAMQLHDRFMDGEPEIPVEWVVRRKDGEPISIVVTAALMIDEDGSRYKITTVTDITHQKRTQEKLEWMEQELKAAAVIQNQLMPLSPPGLSGYSISGLSMPSAAVGGDYFDFISVDEHRLIFSLGDVAGKGMPAALLMSNLHAIVKGQALSECDPALCLELTNRLIFPSIPKDRFISLFFGILDTRTAGVVSANAGHLPPLLLRRNGDAHRFPKGNLALGLRKHAEYRDTETRLESGDLLVIYSDGVIEAMSPRGQEFGEKRLIGSVEARREKPSDEICAGILEDVNSHSSGQTLSDDLTLIVIKKNQ